MQQSVGGGGRVGYRIETIRTWRGEGVKKMIYTNEVKWSDRTSNLEAERTTCIGEMVKCLFTYL